MVIGRISRNRNVQEICIFCTLRNDLAFSRLSRGIHSSRGNSSQSATAERTEDTDTSDLYGSRYNNQSVPNNIAKDGEQASSSLYGARYSTRETPSWKSKAQTPKQLDSNSESISGSSESKSQNVKIKDGPIVRQDRVRSSLGMPWPNNSAPQLHYHKIGKGVDLERKANDTRRIDAESRNSSVKVRYHGGNKMDTERTWLGRATSKSRDEFASPSGATSSIFRRMPDYGSESKSASSSLDRTRDSSVAKPAWRHLKLKAEVASPVEAINAGKDGVARFQPLNEFEAKPRNLPGQQGGSHSIHARPYDMQSITDRIDLNYKSSESYVGFRNDEEHSKTTNENQSALERNVSPKDADQKTSSSNPVIPDKFREGRRAMLWQDENAGARNTTKPKKPRIFRRGGDQDEDDGLDLQKLERIEERQRKKAVQKASRDERASGQVFVVPSFISVGNLATALKIRAEAFSKVLRRQGFSSMSNDHVLDAETAGLIAVELGFKAVLPAKISETDLVAQPLPEDTSLLPPRPPIVTIMGHVDHGKTTLLDWLRNSSIVASEFGGITQHIGAFTVQMPSGRIITFLDTPGHAAFLEMRARGANVTDIVILVIAADDSVKPQTIEAIKHAKAARTQIVVAISKIDKPEANPERVKQDLARHGIEVEDFGGDTQTVCVSGKTGEGMDQLEDAVIALSDILDVKADTSGDVEGWVLEAARNAAGKIATVLVRRGTLRPGQIIVAGHTWARVRNLRNEAGVIIDEALPGTPVEVDGWTEQPEAGAEVLQAPNEQRARRVVDYRIGRAQIEKQATDVAAVNEARKVLEEKRTREKARAAALARGEEVEEEDRKSSKTGIIEIPLIVRADVSGSVEAVSASILSLGNPEVRVSVIRSAVGNVSESDVEHAAAARGHIVSFNLSLDGEILRQAEKAGVNIIEGNIIYRITDDVKSVLEEQLPPLITSHVTGEADILQTFEITLKGKKKLPVAGCKIRNGNIIKGSKVKVLRDDKVIYDGILSTLKSVKKDVTEMRKGNECGMSFDEFTHFQVGDQVQCYETKSEKRRL